jgi:cation:H+ antiporter
MLLELVIFIVALVFLIKSSQLVIDKSILLSEFLGVSQLSIGFILIAIIVSLPDLSVSTIASLSGNISLAVGDALGSTVANICLVLGVVTLLRRVNVERKHTLDASELLLLISCVPLVILLVSSLGRIEGIVLLILFVFYCFFIFKERFKLQLKGGIKRVDIGKTFLLFFASLVVVVVSAKFVVLSAEQLARFFGISDAVIGLTILSFGTTLPELFVDFTAVRRGQIALAVGDILGSSVVNLTLVLGSALILSPIAINLSIFTMAIAFVVISNSFLSYSLIKHEGIGRKQGLIFLLLYIFFIFASFVTGGIG